MIVEADEFLTVPVTTALVYFMGKYAATPYRLFTYTPLATANSYKLGVSSCAMHIIYLLTVRSKLLNLTKF